MYIIWHDLKKKYKDINMMLLHSVDVTATYFSHDKYLYT